ncbi:MAG: hypothetical protein R2830_04460 [Saprospiraceae bacterium]
MKIFNGLFLIIVLILILMSATALATIHWTLFDNYSFSFSPDGINTYLTAFGNYKALFTATVATIAAYFGLLRLKAATDANNDKLKQDRFSEWKTVLDIRFIEIERADPFMRREFTRVRFNLFKQLYNLNFSLSNKEQLMQVFQANFQDLVNFFETQNTRHIGMGGIYPNDTYSYSFDSFRFLLLGCVDVIYPEIVEDLQTLYLTTLPSDRLINGKMYQSALINYKPI